MWVVPNLAILYSTTQRIKEAEATFQEALDIRRQLAKAHPAAYQPDVAVTLIYLANLYSATQRMKEAEAAYREALDIYRQLAKANPAAYEPYVAVTLDNLATMYLQAANPAEADIENREAVSINRERWRRNPVASGDDLARSLIIASKVQSESIAKCQLVHEAARIAQIAEFKELASQLMKNCPPP